MEVEFDLPTRAPQAPPTNGHAVALRQETTPAEPTNPGNTLNVIERLTFDTTVPIERAKQAFAFWQEVRADEAKREFTAAMLACQQEMEPIRKDCDNPQTRSRYASYGALDRAMRPIYTKHGFAVTYDTGKADNLDEIRVFCLIAHKGGHERLQYVDMPCDGKGAKGNDVMTKTHARGSAISYGRRYNLGNGFNVTTSNDDDGNAAGGKPNREPAAPKLISAAQVAELEALAKEVGADVAKFCAYGKVDKLADITVENFPRAKQTLNLKRTAGGATR